MPELIVKLGELNRSSTTGTKRAAVVDENKTANENPQSEA